MTRSGGRVFGLELRTALFTFFGSSVLGGLTSSFIDHRVWLNEHTIARREQWCEMTQTFEDNVSTDIDAEIFWGEETIYARLRNEKDAVIETEWNKYLTAEASDRVATTLNRARVKVYYGDSAAQQYVKVVDGLDSLESDVISHREVAASSPDRVRDDSVHIHDNTWPGENAADNFVQNLVMMRKSYCTDESPTPSKG